MANPAITDLQHDVGDLYGDLTNGTTAATSLLTKAKTEVSDITGTTTGYDMAIRNLADSLICRHIMGSRTHVDWSSEGKSYGRKEVMEMHDQFYDDYIRAMRKQGYTIDGVSPHFQTVNQ